MPQHRLRVRPAVPEDAAAIGETHAASWEAAYEHIFDASFLARSAEGRRVGWSQTLPGLLIAPSSVLVAERDGTVVGFAHASPQPAGPLTAEIHGFYVHPAAWGTGVAERLMAQTSSRLAVDSRNVVLWVLRDAKRARRFYEKVGFRSTGREQMQSLSDWTTAASVERPVVELGRSLAIEQTMRT